MRLRRGFKGFSFRRKLSECSLADTLRAMRAPQAADEVSYVPDSSLSERGQDMSDKDNSAARPRATPREEAYRMAKQLRQANRELERQLNIKKAKRAR